MRRGLGERQKARGVWAGNSDAMNSLTPGSCAGTEPPCHALMILSVTTSHLEGERRREASDIADPQSPTTLRFAANFRRESAGAREVWILEMEGIS